MALDSGSVSIYPMAEWEKIIGALEKKSDDSNLIRFAILAARWGKRNKIDKQGRILVNKELSNKLNIQGKVIIEGIKNHLRLKKLSP